MPFERQRLERRKDNEPLDGGGISRWHSKHGSGLGHGHFLSNDRPPRSQIGYNLRRNVSDGFSSYVRRRANADLGRLGNFVQHTTGRVQQDRAALVLCRIGPHAPLVRDRL
jgi:hypothetical protein